MHTIRSRSYLFLVVMGLAVILSGCSLTPRLTTPSSIEQLSHWRAKGKLGVNIDGKARSAAFDWQHTGEDFDIKLHGTLGIGGARLTKNSAGVRLKTSEGTAEAQSAQTLMEQHLGWSIPVTEMVFWLKGMPARSAPVDAQQKDSAGRLISLSQHGWDIRYLRYHSEDQLVLPRKIIASRGNLKLNLVVKDWQY